MSLPPAIFVCALQIAQKPFRLTDDYVAPKGALIMPSIVAANMQVNLFQHMRRTALFFSYSVYSGPYLPGWHHIYC